MTNQLFYGLGIGAPIVAALFAFVLIQRINRRDAGTEQMRRIAG